MDAEFLSPEEKSFLLNLQEKKIIQSAGRLDFLTEKQRYHAYPARYRKNAHWSLTGACNMRCRHCFMSAPHKKHVVPELKELLNIAEQLAECGTDPRGQLLRPGSRCLLVFQKRLGGADQKRCTAVV